MQERDFLLSNDLDEIKIKNRYTKLINILDSATSGIKVDYGKSLLRNIQDFIYKVQTTALHEKIVDLESLKTNNKINYNFYKNIIELKDYKKDNSFFKCTILIKKFNNIPEKIIEFDSDTNPTKLKFKN